MSTSPAMISTANSRLVRAAACVFGFMALQAGAACLPSADPEIRAYERRIGTQPAAVATELQARLRNASALDDSRRAQWLATLAQSLSAMDRHEEVRAVAEEGMRLIDDHASPTFVNLIASWAANTFEEASVPHAIATVEAVHARQPEGSPGEACTLIALGQLQHQADRSDRASAHLTRAYRISAGAARTAQRVMAADTLSLVMRDVRDFPQALALNQEVIDWDVATGATYNLATSRFFRAAILHEMGDHHAAVAELTTSRLLSESVNDQIGIAYGDLLLCQSNLVLREVQLARQQCDSALRAFEREHSVEALKQALTGLAHADLLEQQPAAALERLNRVLDQDGRDVVPRRLVGLYALRAQAHAALGHTDEALADYQAHMERFKSASEADRAQEAAAIRAQFETDREIERNAFLQRELEAQRERLAVQTANMRWMIAAVVASIALVLLLISLLLENKRKKATLARLAQQDDLTDLPNRRRTFELASDAFESARQQGLPITVGILDLDHFKRINDRFGHATGDLVLQEFARVGRMSIRERDILGRWGGEEFLLVLPNTTLDVALEIVDRVRSAAAGIRGGALAEDLHVTLSAGLATNEGAPAHLEALMASADAALYDAKADGRDLVRVALEGRPRSASG